jgi:hypothetical protein
VSWESTSICSRYELTSLNNYIQKTRQEYLLTLNIPQKKKKNWKRKIDMVVKKSTIVTKGNAKITIDFTDCQSHCMQFEMKVIDPSGEPEFFQFFTNEAKDQSTLPGLTESKSDQQISTTNQTLSVHPHSPNNE